MSRVSRSGIQPPRHTPPVRTPSSVSRARLSGALVLLLALAGCATTEDRRFPLTYLAGQEAALRTETAREALPYYQRVAGELERQGRFDEATIAYANATVTARALGRLQESLDAALKAVETGERTKRPGYLTRALLHLGNTYLQLNAPQKAIPAFERAVAQAKQSADPPREAMGYVGLGSSYRRLKRPDLAAQNGAKAVEILEVVLQRASGEAGRAEKRVGASSHGSSRTTRTRCSIWVATT